MTKKSNGASVITRTCYILCVEQINKQSHCRKTNRMEMDSRKETQLFRDVTPESDNQRPRNMVHNFSSYDLSAEEYNIL